jgi:hypothetical protein
VADYTRVEKRKWDGTLSAVETALVVAEPTHMVSWFVPAGSARRRPARHAFERLDTDEIWATVFGQWWVLCGKAAPDQPISSFVLHAAVPLSRPEPGLIRWIDLDLDFEVEGAHVALEDEEQFHRHAHAMAYPPDVIEGAWAGISQVAPHYTTGTWPFDGWVDGCLAAGRAALAD